MLQILIVYNEVNFTWGKQLHRVKLTKSHKCFCSKVRKSSICQREIWNRLS